MTSKLPHYIFCIASLFILMQPTIASLPAVVIIQYTPILAKLSSNLSDTASANVKNIRATSTLIENFVDTAQLSVDDQIVNLNQLVQETSANANASGSNINNCVIANNQEVNTIRLKSLNQCRTPKTVDDLRKKIVDMKNLKIQLSLKTDACIVKHPISGTKLKACFDGLIQQIQDESTEIQGEIQNVLDKAISDTTSCVETTLGRLDLSIGAVERSFKYCASSKQ